MEISKKIAQKAHALFTRYGIRSTSMDDIASDLGISKKTVYQFYSNKNSLVETFVDKEIDEHIFRCKFLTANSDDAIIELYFLLEYTKELYHIISPAVIYDLEKNHELGYEKIKDHKAVFIYEILKANILRGIKTGLYREDFDINVITTFFLESMALMSDPEIFPRIHHSKIQPTEEIFACLISGIVTPVGLEVVGAYKIQRSIMLLSNSEDGPFWDS